MFHPFLLVISYPYTLEHLLTITLPQPKDQPEAANGQTEGNGDATNGKAVTADTDTPKNDNDNKIADDGADSDEDCNFDDIDAALEKEKKKILEVKDIFIYQYSDIQRLLPQKKVR